MLPALTHRDPGDESDAQVKSLEKAARDLAAAYATTLEEAAAIIRRSLDQMSAAGRAELYARAAQPQQVCEECGQWNAGTTVLWGLRLCGRASCLRVGLRRWRDAA